MSEKKVKVPVQLVPIELDEAFTPVEAIGKIALKINRIIETQNILTEYIRGITEPIAREIIEEIAQEVIEEQIGEIVADLNQLKTDVAIHATQITTLTNSKQNKQDNSLQTMSKTVVEAINEINTKIENFSTSKQDAIDNSLETVSKAIVGAINELNSNKQSKNDAGLNTTSKLVVGAINEILSSVSLKQDISATTLQTTAKNIVGAINEIYNAQQTDEASIASLQSAITGKQDKNDTTLLTTAKTIVGGINELFARPLGTWGQITGTLANQSDLSTALGLKQDKTDNALQTTAKTVVGAINEINAKPQAVWGQITGTLTNQTDLNTALGLKQDKTDNALQTTAKTVVGAINELKDYAKPPHIYPLANNTISSKNETPTIKGSELDEIVELSKTKLVVLNVDIMNATSTKVGTKSYKVINSYKDERASIPDMEKSATIEIIDCVTNDIVRYDKEYGILADVTSKTIISLRSVKVIEVANTTLVDVGGKNYLVPALTDIDDLYDTIVSTYENGNEVILKVESSATAHLYGYNRFKVLSYEFRNSLGSGAFSIISKDGKCIFSYVYDAGTMNWKFNTIDLTKEDNSYKAYSQITVDTILVPDLVNDDIVNLRGLDNLPIYITVYDEYYSIVSFKKSPVSSGFSGKLVIQIDEDHLAIYDGTITRGNLDISIKELS